MSPIAGGPHSLEKLERTYPWIKWREPLKAALFNNPDETHYACRVCIANDGLKGPQILDLPTDPSDIEAHIILEHA